MTNSDAFADIHQYRASQTLRALTVMQRQLAAVLADAPRMLQAFRIEELAPGSGLAGGSVSGGDRPDPTANTALARDRGAEVRARWDLAIAEAVSSFAELTRICQAELYEPTPTGLCRHGDCPEKKVATRGVKARDGMPRCEACYTFWLNDVATPMHQTHERQERPRRGASPRRIGFPKQDAVA